MNIFGFEITRKEPRDNHPFGRVVFNIQIREHGLTLAGPDGTGAVPTTVNPRAYLLGMVHAERFGHDWNNTIIDLTDDEVKTWFEKETVYKSYNDPAPHDKALAEILKARESSDKINERDKDVS